MIPNVNKASVDYKMEIQVIFPLWTIWESWLSEMHVQSVVVVAFLLLPSLWEMRITDCCRMVKRFSTNSITQTLVVCIYLLQLYKVHICIEYKISFSSAWILFALHWNNRKRYRERQPAMDAKWMCEMYKRVLFYSHNGREHWKG